MAIKAGVQNLVHFTGVNIDHQNSIHLEWIESLKDRDASWVTTLMIDKALLYPAHPEWFEDKDMLPVYRNMKRELSSEQIERANFLIQLFKVEYGLKESSLIAFMEHHVEDIQFLYNSGINMVLGTDTGNKFNFHGYSLHEEMQLLELGGMNPLDIIKMGTLNAAKMMESDNKLGSIEIGKLADMILLDKNPLESISHSLSINHVIKNGIVQKRMI